MLVAAHPCGWPLRPNPFLIGRPEARLREATGCAVYQLTSAYRTTEQQSGWRDSASSPSEFSAFKHPAQVLGDWKKIYITVLPQRGDNCIVGSIAWAQPPGLLGRFLGKETRFSRGAASWSSLLHHHAAAQRPRTSRLFEPWKSASASNQAERFPRSSERGVSEESTLCWIANAVIVRNVSRRAQLPASCKFGLKRTVGSLCAAASDRLEEASCRSVCS